VTVCNLGQLYKMTTELFTSPNAPLAGLDWVDRVLPRITSACADAVVAGSRSDIKTWREWVEGDGLEGIRDAGDPEMFVWRRDWITTLLDAADALLHGGAHKDREKREAIAARLKETAAAPFATNKKRRKRKK